MNNPKIIANCLVKNEEKWIWYAIMSVIDHVDEILVWDTGSTDSTVEIIKSISNPKIKFTRFDSVNPDQFTALRQQMLEKSARFDWLLILDGDEIWPKNAIEETVSAISSGGDYVVNHYKNLLGDVYHYQKEKAGKYRIGDIAGHVTIRVVNLKKIPGLHFALPYGQEGLFDGNNTPIQNRKPEKSVLVRFPYLHATHLHRSSKDFEVMQRQRKYKYEWGKSMPYSFLYPPCFYLPRPKIVPSAWMKRSFMYSFRSACLEPLYLIKRLFI